MKIRLSVPRAKSHIICKVVQLREKYWGGKRAHSSGTFQIIKKRLKVYKATTNTFLHM